MFVWGFVQNILNNVKGHMAAPTSTCFIATLPTMEDTSFDKLYHWSKTQCVRADFVRSPDGCMRMVVERKAPNSVRGFQKMLRTNLRNYGVSLPDKMDSWLKLVEPDEYQPMKLIASGAGRAESNKTPPTDHEDSSDEGSEQSTQEESVGNVGAPECTPAQYPVEHMELCLPRSLLTTPIKAN